MLFAYIGAFAIRNTLSDVWIMAGFAVLGLLLQRFGFPLAPLVLGAILGPLAERYFTTTMISTDNDPSVFLTRPVSAVLVVVWLALIAYLTFRAGRVSPRDPRPPGRRPGRPAGRHTPGTDPHPHQEKTRA